jgi:hypothetical protein
MLTIKNINKLNNKGLGKKNFYVARVRETFDLDMGNRQSINHKYIFELSNMKYAITVTLNRDEWNTNTYNLQSSNGNTLYITLLDIRNMDKFLDKLRFVALG